MRERGPIPGKKPKNVGEALALNCRRLPWRRNSPPVNWLRIMNGPAPVAFTIAMPGCSFQELAKNDGRLMPVLHSTRDSYVSPNSTFPTAPVLSPGSANSWRPWIRESVIDRLLTQFHRPRRSGVLMVIVV